MNQPHPCSRLARLNLAAIFSILFAGFSASGQTVSDPGFETPATSSYVYNPTGTAWTFAGNSGVQQNGSGWYAPAAPDGVQTAFLQLSGGTNGAISQTINFSSTGSFYVSFAAAGRNYYGAQSLNVEIDGAAVGTFTPASTTSFTTYTTSAFTISTTGNHTLSFVGTGMGSSDLTDFIDSVAIEANGGTAAVPANGFLNSLGINIHVSQGIAESSYEPLLSYTGIRNVRDGSTGSTSSYITLHQNTGVLFDITGTDLTNLVSDSTSLANASALLSIEGPNEPNNWPFVYNGQTGGGSGTWVPVGDFQKDLYSQVKASSTLKNYPVFSVSEGGAETDNVGLQWLTIPIGAGCLLPDGTQFADYANVHNYVCGNSGAYVDNNAWNASSPTLVSGSSVDGLYGEFGVTWAHSYAGYSNTQLQTLPRVTTETGWPTGSGALTEDEQGKMFLNLFLAACKRGWDYTFIYQMRDNEGGGSNTWGIYNADSTPKLAATYIHNLTTILSDTVSNSPGNLSYSIPNEATIPTVHDLLLQKSSGVFYLAVWDERPVGEGTDSVTVNLGGTFASVSVYDPTVGTSATQTLSNVSSVPITLTDHPVILALYSTGGPAPAIADAGFEAPATSSYVYNPTGTAWTFSGDSGVQENGSGWYAPTAPDGVQTAFIQLHAGTNGSISQTLHFSSPGSYTVSFAAAGRNYYGAQPLNVEIDGMVAGTFTPGSTTSFTTYTTNTFTISTAGNHTLSFVGAATGTSDLADFIDSISIQ